MAEAATGGPARRALPPALELLWGRRERGKRGPRPGLSAEAIVEAAVRIADAEGIEAISMARVAAELGFTTMSLYRHVASKDELIQLMYNNSARGAEDLVLEGGDWRAKLRHWAIVQRDVLDLHPWITQLPMPTPPLAPSSLHFVERALEALDSTGLPATDKLRAIGLIASYTLSEARMAHDTIRAAKAATAATATGTTGDSGTAEDSGTAGTAGDFGTTGDSGTAGAGGDSGKRAADATATWPPPTYEELLRELVDEPTFPRLYHIAWDNEPDSQPSEREEFLFGIELILDGVQARIDRGY